MSTQPVSNSLFQELQSFYQNRSADTKHFGSSLQEGDLKQARQVHSAHHGDLLTSAFVVTISSTQNQPVDAQRESFWHQRRVALDQLGTALQSGDAAATQQAYDALVVLGQNGPLRNGATFHRADRAQDFAAFGEALQSGDLAGAQDAFAALESTFRNHTPKLLGPPTPAPVQLPLGPPTPAPIPLTRPPHQTLPPDPPTFIHPPPSLDGGPSGPPEIIINVGGLPSPNGRAGEIVVNLAQPSNTPEEIQIKFGDNHASGQLTIDVNQQSGGGEEVSINFNPSHSHYQLVLNLLQSASSSAPQNGSVSLQA
jgi:hypothetical protein